MANHKSLTIALFASAAIMGLAGCSDDSSGNIDSNELLSLDKYESKLTKNSQDIVKATHTAAAVTAKSADESCVTVSVAKSPNEDNVSSVVLQAVGAQACNTVITVKGDKAEKEIKAYLVYGVSVLSVAESVTLETTATKRITATYAKDDVALADSVLNVSVADPTCASVAADSVTVNAKGEAYIDITAGAESCETKLTVTSKDESDKTKTVSIKVLGEDEPVIVEGGKLEFVTLKPAAGPVSITLSNGKKQEFQVRYSDKNGKGIEHALISFEDIDNDDCFGLSASKTLKTKEDGTVKQGVTVKSKAIDGCSGRLNITTSDASIEPIVANITVAATEYYDISITMTTASKKIDTKVGYARAGLLDGVTCEQAIAMRDQWLTKVEDAEYKTDEAAFTPNGNPFAMFEDMMVEVADGKVAVVGYGTAGDESTDILAYGCTEINRIQGSVNIELKEVPVEIKGTYDIVSNFDISSAFTKDKHDELPAVENMNAGDWIDWVVNLFEDPITALYDFIWVNSISRLGTIDGIPEWLTNFVLGSGTKQLVLDLFEKELKTYLEAYPWYTILVTVAPDIKDLVTNMQFKGTMTVSEVAADGLAITKANQKYDQLQYRWSYDKANNSACNNSTIFTEPDTCRLTLMLDNSAYTTATVTGDWTGKVYSGDTVNSLSIDEHKMQLKWATILYNAVFGEILPRAMGYNATSSENLKNGRLVSAFLEKVLFETVSKAYTDGREEYNQQQGCNCSFTTDGKKETCTGGEKCRYALQTSAPCAKFIEAIIYYVYPEAKDYVNLIGGTVANLACGDKGLGQLDQLVANSLNKVQAGSFKIKSDSDYSCMLYEDSTASYQRVGNTEMELNRGKKYSIFDINAEKLSTNRCRWNFEITDNYTMSGLFHAVRNTK